MFFVGSPFTCKIFKPDQIVTNEDGLKMCHVNRPATITIDNPSDSAVCKVTVTAPNGHHLPIDSVTKADNKILSKFTPTEVGKFSVVDECQIGPTDTTPLARAILQISVNCRSLIFESIFGNFFISPNIIKNWKKWEGRGVENQKFTNQDIGFKMEGYF